MELSFKGDPSQVKKELVEALASLSAGERIPAIPVSESVTISPKKHLKLKITSDATAEEQGKEAVIQTLNQIHGISVQWSEYDTQTIAFMKGLYPGVSLRALVATVSDMPKDVLSGGPPRTWLPDAFKNAALLLSGIGTTEENDDMSRNTIPNQNPEPAPPMRERVGPSFSEMPAPPLPGLGISLAQALAVGLTAEQIAALGILKPVPLTAPVGISPLPGTNLLVGCASCGAPPGRHFSDCPNIGATAGPCPQCQAPAGKHFSDCPEAGASVGPRGGGGAIPARVSTGFQPHPSQTGGKPVQSIEPAPPLLPGNDAASVVMCPSGGMNCPLPHKTALAGTQRVAVHVTEDITRVFQAAIASGMISLNAPKISEKIAMPPMTMPESPERAIEITNTEERTAIRKPKKSRTKATTEQEA